MTSTGPTLAPSTLAWAERTLAPGARVVGATRLGGPTGPWLLRVRRSGDELAAVLRAGDPRSVDERRRFRVESAALQAAEQYGVAAPRLIGSDPTGHDASQLAVLTTPARVGRSSMTFPRRGGHIELKLDHQVRQLDCGPAPSR